VIDRIDEKEGKLRVLDYKTGSGNLDFSTIDEVFEHNNDKRPKYILQTFLYGLLYKQFTAGKTMTPGIIYLRDTHKENFSTEIFNKLTKEKVVDFGDYEDEFVQGLTACLESIFDPKIPFSQTESNKPCEYCQYKTICNR
jgi:ATP-dependent helicase/DNAse subunit B